MKKLIVLGVAGMMMSLLLAARSEISGGEEIYEKQSLYQTIFVRKQGPVVTMKFGRRASVSIQTQVNLDDLRKHCLEYTKLSFCGLLYKPEPRRMLVLGLGGGVIPRDLRHYFPEAQIDVAEIDGAIPPIAKDYFAFAEDDKLKVHVEDGRIFVKKQLRRDEPPQYDLVVLDAFNGDYIPFHLMTKEFLEELRGVLSPDGVVVANVFYTNRLFDAELATFMDVFDRCRVFEGRYSGNAMIVALGPQAQSPEGQALLETADALQEKHDFAFSLPAVARCIVPNAKPAPKTKVLTDDRAPVNWLREQEKQ